MDEITLLHGSLLLIVIGLLTVSRALQDIYPVMNTPSSLFFELWVFDAMARTIILGSWAVQPVLTSSVSPHSLFYSCIYAPQLYVLLILWSPSPIITNASEKNYYSHASPKTPKPLSNLQDPATVDLTVVIPAFNESERLPLMLSQTVDHLTTVKKHSYEILIVDDGSTDNTFQESIKLAGKYPKSNIRVCKLEKNLGKGGAVRHGMLYSSGEQLLMVDADGASRFNDLELLWEAMEEIAPEKGAGVVVGSRAHLVKTDAVVKVCPSIQLPKNKPWLIATCHSAHYCGIF